MILGELSRLGDTMWDLYEELITIHAVVHLDGLQQQKEIFVKTLKMYKLPLLPCRDGQCDTKGNHLNCQRK